MCQELLPVQPASTVCGTDLHYAVDVLVEQSSSMSLGVKAPHNIEFNIVLETLVLGGAPKDAVKLGCVLSIVLMIAGRFVVPSFSAILRRVSHI